MPGEGEAGERISAPCPRTQGLSRRAHAFSVEALVGKSCKRMKMENIKDEKMEQLEKMEKLKKMETGPISDGDSETPTCTVVGEEEDHEYQNEEKCETASKPEEEKPEPDTQIRVDLQGSELWNRFHEIGTEMIITKAGRRMFPSVRVKVRNLDPFKQYYIAMDIMLVDSKRYRYVYHSSQWMVAGNTDQSCIRPRLYIHPDSPCSGETWMRQVINFDRVKLTNNEMDDKGHIILQSMHKYKPRVHVVEHDPRQDVSQISALPSEGVQTFSFPETQFTTVTAYQNQQITKLKIDRNPFAKGFRDPGRNRGVLDGILESYPWRSPFNLDLKPFSLELQGTSSGSLESCGTISPLKNFLPPSGSSFHHPLSLSNHEATLHNLTVPVCYKLNHSNHPLTNRTFSSIIPDRLRTYSGLRHLADLSLLSPLHGKKTGGCRGPCLHSHCPLSIQNLQAGRASGTPQNTAISSLIQPYGLYSYNLPISQSKPVNSVSLASSESLLCHTAWHSAANHWL